jgi:selenide,water dikinase
LISDPNLIVGMERGDDAGVYKLREDLAIIQTLDFFTPIVDDPYTFGQVAVANSLSDVYAMGGKPVVAMNIICFPINKMDISILQDVLKGGLAKMREAEVLLVGGHSVEDDELKYGLSVTGIVHPEKVWGNQGAIAGDRIVLTKPLGSGIISTALKGKTVDQGLVDKCIEVMTSLNKRTSELMKAVDIHACTDITGFGLLGHICEMIEGSDVGMVIDSSAVPYFHEVIKLVEMGMVAGGLHRNKKFRMHMVDVAPHVPDYVIDIFFDPQTSGGLLFSLPEDQAEDIVKKMHAEGIGDAAIVGEVTGKPKGKILVR